MDAATKPRPLRIIKQANNPPVILHVPKQRRTRAGPVPAAPVPFANDTRSRAVTVGSMQSGIPNSTSQHLGTLKPSGTQPSLRQRLLSRVMSGVSNKSQVGHAAMEREIVARQLHGNDTGEAQAAQDVQEVGGLRPSTASSIGSVSTLGCNLELALAAFPTPPTSTVTSPTTLSSFETSRTTSTPARRLVQPTNNAIPGAQLILLPEIDQLNFDTGKSVFVAVEIAGIVGPMDESYDVSARLKGLDVAVVIDSTLFTSPTALLAHCEATRFIASLLDPTVDRLAVLTTRPQTTDPPDFNIVSPLSHTTIRTIKSVVDTIVSSTERPDPAALGIAIECAIDLLTDFLPRPAESEPKDDAYGHVFVVTGNPDKLDPKLVAHHACTISVVSPGNVPWRGPDPVMCNGWKLGYACFNVLPLAGRRKHKNSDGLFNCLRDLIAYARGGRACGKVMDLVLDIEAGPSCSIEMVMGQKNIAELRPGEVVTALVKVKVGTAAAKGYTLSPSPASKTTNGSSSTSRDLLDELDIMLGTSPAPILVAKLTYRHSLLPTGTRCSTIAAAKVKRSVPDSPSNRTVSKSTAQRNPENRSTVQKRLTYYLATHHSPRQAILALSEHFGDNGAQSSCPEYIKLVIGELKFQARMIERFDLPNLVQSTPLTTHNSSTSNTYEHFGHGLFVTSNYKPQDWLIGVPDEDCGPSSPEKLAMSEKALDGSQAHYGHHKAELLRSESRRPVPRPSARQAGVALSTKRHSGVSHATRKPSVDEVRKTQGRALGRAKENVAPWAQ